MAVRRFLLVCAALAWPAAVPAQGALIQPLLEYKFNSADSSSPLPAGSLVVNSGSVGAAGDLTMMSPGSPGAAANLYTADGGGVSGTSGDRAFDNTISTAMGNVGSPVYSGSNRGPGATNDADNGILNGRTALTVTGWIKTAPDVALSNLAQIWAGDAGNFMHIRGSEGGKLTLAMQTTVGNNTLTTATADWSAQGQWMFLALVWNGGAVGEATFYKLDSSNVLTSVQSFTAANLQGAVTDTPQTAGTPPILYGLSLGNQAGLRLRPFDGSMDNFRVYDMALSTEYLQALANADLQNLTIPEPTACQLTLLAMTSLIARTRRRQLGATPSAE